MPANLSQLIQGVTRSQKLALDGARDGLASEVAEITRTMRDNPAHGDQTGASHANYSARAVGRGEDGSADLASARASATALNADEVGPTTPIAINGEVGVIFDSQLTYSLYLETLRAGEHAVIGPTVAASGQRLTQAAANGSKKALGS